MKRLGSRKIGALALFAAIALVAFGTSGSASGVTVTAGNIDIKIDGTALPKKLPKKRMAPITLKVEGDLSTRDGSLVPPLKTLSLDFDKNGIVYKRGLPTCQRNKLLNTLTSQALKVCRKALVGRGHTVAKVQFPDQAPFNARGPLLIFNGPGNTQIYHVYALVPAPTTFVVVAKVKKQRKGPYGTNVFQRIPPIAGGYGSLTHFEATVKRTWRFKGKKRSYLYARCANGKFFARGEFAFGDGTKVRGNIIKRCVPTNNRATRKRRNRR